MLRSRNAELYPLVQTRRAWMEVVLPSIVHNATIALAHTNGERLLAVIKADAYGLGAEAVATALGVVNPWGFAVATIDEGAVLRDCGVKRPILVLQPALWCDRYDYAAYSLLATVDDLDLMERWPSAFHVEIDTGMRRSGIAWDLDAFGELPWHRAGGIFTHFHAADSSAESVRTQFHRFSYCLSKIPDSSRLVRHAANSHGIAHQLAPLDLIRPGFYLFGGPSFGLPRPQPVVSVRARVCSVRKVEPGCTVGYGVDHVLPEGAYVGTVAIGYADGIPYGLANAEVLISGKRCSLVGNVTMDMLMVNLGPRADWVQVGDTATIIGSDGPLEISLAEFARNARSIPYEILTRMSPRLPRLYHMPEHASLNVEP